MEIQQHSKLSIGLLLGCLAILLLGFVLIIRGRTASSGVPGVMGGNGAWLAVRLFPDQQGWAETVHGVLHTTDNGQHWTDATPWTSADYVSGGRTDELVSFLDGNRAWLILPGRTTYVKFGQNQQPELARSYSTIDGGKTWHDGQLPDTGSTYRDTMSGAGFVGGFLNPQGSRYESRGQVSINGISALDGQTAWVMVSKTATQTGSGQESIVPLYSRIWQSNDGGKTWKLIRDEKPENGSASGGSGMVLGGWITFLDSTTGFMAGPTPATVLASHDAGANWTAQQLSGQKLTPQELQQARQGRATFFNRQDGVIVISAFVNNQDTREFIYATHNGGQSWHLSNVQEMNPYAGGLFCLDAQDWMVMANQTTLLKTTDGGATWSTIHASTGFAYLSDVTFVSGQEGWAIGRKVQVLQGSQYTQDGWTTLLKTVNGGQTWVPVVHS